MSSTEIISAFVGNTEIPEDDRDISSLFVDMKKKNNRENEPISVINAFFSRHFF